MVNEFQVALNFTKIKKDHLKKLTNWTRIVKNGIGRMSKSGYHKEMGKIVIGKLV